MENHKWNVWVFKKKQITKLFVKRKYLSLQTRKVWRLASAAFEIQLGHGVWGPTFQRSLLPTLKQFPKVKAKACGKQFVRYTGCPAKTYIQLWRSISNIFFRQKNIKYIPIQHLNECNFDNYSLFPLIKFSGRNYWTLLTIG